MKKYLFIAVMTSLTGLISCRDNDDASTVNSQTYTSEDANAAHVEDIPAAVKNAFTARYTHASDVEWESEKEDGKMVYEAKFEMNGEEMEAEFDANGNLIQEKDD